MKHFIQYIIVIAVLSGCNQPGNESAKEGKNSETNVTKGDWVSLYNGKDFTGWHSYGGDTVGSAWKAADSAIHLNVLQKKDWQTFNGGDLVTDQEYENFDLKLEWKISIAGNSGIFFYVKEDIEQFKNPNQSGLEMQINDNYNKHGMIEKQRAGDLAELLASSSAKVVKPAGQWNQVEIRSDRGKLDFFMNGQHTLSTILWDDNWEELIENSKFKKINDFGTYKKGRIALQDHGEDVWFRNIMIRKL